MPPEASAARQSVRTFGRLPWLASRSSTRRAASARRRRRSTLPPPSRRGAGCRSRSTSTRRRTCPPIAGAVPPVRGGQHLRLLPRCAPAVGARRRLRRWAGRSSPPTSSSPRSTRQFGKGPNVLNRLRAGPRPGRPGRGRLRAHRLLPDAGRAVALGHLRGRPRAGARLGRLPRREGRAAGRAHAQRAAARGRAAHRAALRHHPLRRPAQDVLGHPRDLQGRASARNSPSAASPRT